MQSNILASVYILGTCFYFNDTNLKTKQKVVTSFRTFKGAQNHARIQSFVSTVRKHKMNAFENLISVFNQKKVVFQVA